MKEILINYPIKFLQQELINIRTGFRVEKKKIMEILRTMKSIKKLSKEELIDLLIKYNYDISKIPKLESLIKPIKEKQKQVKKEEFNNNEKLKLNSLNENILNNFVNIVSKKAINTLNKILEYKEKLKKNPKLERIREYINDNNSIFIKDRTDLINNLNILYDDLKEYNKISKYRFKLLYLRITHFSVDIIIKKFIINKDELKSNYDNNYYYFQDKNNYDNYEYNNEFNNYLNYDNNNKIKPSELLFYLNQLIFMFLKQYNYYIFEDFLKNYMYLKNNNKLNYLKDIIIPDIDENFFKESIKEINKFINEKDNNLIDDLINNLKKLIEFDKVKEFKIENVEIKEKPKKEVLDNQTEIINDCNIIITKYYELTKKYNVVKILNDNKENSNYNKIYNNFMSFRYTKNQISKYKNNIKKLNEILNYLTELYNEYKIILEEPKEKEVIAKQPEIKKFMIKKNKVSTDDFLKMIDDFKSNTYEWSKQAYEVGLTDNEILSYSGLKENDYKILNAFFTPNDIIKDMIDFSFLYENLINAKTYNTILNILEPTGGIGNIIYYILENINKENEELLNYIKIDFVEFNPTFIEIAKAKLDKYKDIINYYNIDFFKFETDKKYDFIFGNPPYNMKFNNKTIYDVDFFNKCWELLDFKIIFLMSSTSLIGKTQSHKKFKELINYTEKELIDYGKLHKYENNFKKGETPAGITNVKTYLYIIDKNE